MNCWRIQNLIAPFLDGELPSAESALIGEHLGACPACDSLVQRVAALPDLTPPELSGATGPLLDGFDARLKERIALSASAFAPTIDMDEESSAWGSTPRLPRPANNTVWLAAACFGLLAALGAWGWTTSNRIEDLELAVSERDALIQRLERQVVANRFDPRALPETAGSDSLPIFLPASAPSAQPLPASFLPVAYGFASADGPRIRR